jgi:hypothetical protein
MVEIPCCTRQLASAYDHRSFGPPMCDKKPPKGSDDTSEGEPQRMTMDHLRRAADRWPDLRDPVLIVKAWDEPPTPDATSATNSPRRFGQLQNLSVPDNFDVRLRDAEIAAWEGDSPSQAPGGQPGQL